MVIGELTNETILSAYKATSKFFLEPVKNPLGIEIINKMKKNNFKYLDDFSKSSKISFNNVNNILNLWYN